MEEKIKKNIVTLSKQLKVGEISHDIGMKNYSQNGNKESLEKNLAETILYNMLAFSKALNSDIDTKELNIKGISYPYECYVCGKRPHFKIVKGELIEDEPHCVDLGDFSFEIDVPTGELVFCDWTDAGRDILNGIDSDGDININFLSGKKEMSELYLKHNIGTFFVGNTSPHILQKGNQILVERPAYDEENDTDIFSDDSFEDKGYVCTDLWWCTFFDLKVYQTLIGEKISAKDAGAHVVVNVDPG